MALNGLDALALKEAFDFACSEPGWFLMKYESRDDIVLLGKGASAVKDMRELISHEPDDSPVYGFIRYRRRNILIKLVPDNTSRVLKARSQVHFQSVIERFSPCDVTVSLKSYKELTDAALTTACSTHTATASISSSSSSLRQRRLTDIQEASEEGLENQDNESKAESTSKVVENQQGLQVIVTTHDPGVSSDGKRGPIEVEISAPEPIKVESEVEDFKIPDTIEEETGGLSRSNSISRDDNGPPRKSTSSALRPTAEDIYAELALKYQPKVKLGPRPSADWNKRPHTASAATATASTASLGTSSAPPPPSGPPEKSGPTASVPKNIHLPMRMPTRKARSGSQGSSKLQFHEAGPASNKGPLRHPGPPPPLQFASANSNTPNSFPSAPLSPTPSFTSIKSSRSAFSLATPIGAVSAAAAGSSAGISPEKARLMKALELRKKALSQQTLPSPATPTQSQPKPTEELSGPPSQPEQEEEAPASNSNPRNSPSPTATIEPNQPTSTNSNHASSPVDEMATIVTESSASSSITPSEPTSLNNSVPDTPTQGSHAATSEAVTAENTLPSPTQAPSTSTEHDSQKSYSDDLDKESESSYGVSDINGDSVESNTITDDGEDRIATRLHPPPPTLLLPTPKSTPEPAAPKVRENVPPEIVTKAVDNKPIESKKDDTPPRSPLLHLNMLHPKTPADYMESQKLPKHNRLPSTEVPVIETARSVSAPFLNNQDKKPVLVASSRKVSVASSISQRIKNLEMLSKPSSPPALAAPVQSTQRSRPSSPTPQFPSVRTNSLKTSASSPNLSPLLGARVTTPSRIDSPFLNKKSIEELSLTNKSPTGTYSPSKSRTGSFGEISGVSGRKASVSSLNITTIAEPPTFPIKKDDSAPASADGSPTDKSKSKISPLLRRMSSSKSKKSTSPVSSGTTTPVRPVTAPGISPISTPANTMPPPPVPKPVAIAPVIAPVAPAPTPSPAPTPAAASKEAEKKTLLTGWVNVQLPNTMFWKRRYLKIESDSWLYLTTSADESSPLTGKYNIKTEVMAAMKPDIDEQELPYSVNLRLVKGGVLACACENDQELSNILSVVKSCIA
ncbi:hypothetical protein H072_8949 [Dactylellina haptotyla CBS 200.50]|uniref:ADF-H domain-containing protein n=1 Tax=Dactylellina haptotyla (strain CBS 200.50) TaxID=1284197 RepID=S8A3S0_DACHA|nr:hypothetical protein H072_8949 [Dactylellina haptotyla CBS 200.50]